jgi:predicted Rossmann fold flavoprotein
VNKGIWQKEERMSEGNRIVVIGGGVAGMTAAICAARRGATVHIIEREERLGRKILLTGNGKCNLGNISKITDQYNTDFVKKIFSKYGMDVILTFLKEIGIVTRITEGRIYPYSNEASTVQNALREEIVKSGVKVILDKEVTSITERFLINNKYICDKIVLASGSPATIGQDSTILFERFGHKKRPMKPALVPLISDRYNLKGLKGVRVIALAKLFSGEHKIAECLDEVMFKDYGISGTAIFNLSVILARRQSMEDSYVELDLMPEYSLESVAEMVSSLNGINGLFHKELCNNIYRNAVFKDPIAIAKEIKQYRVNDVRLGPFNLAQIASGGLDTDSFDPITLESKLCKGIFAAGEVLDVDGECGGYNLMWAFASGLAVGNAL